MEKSAMTSLLLSRLEGWGEKNSGKNAVKWGRGGERGKTKKKGGGLSSAGSYFTLITPTPYEQAGERENL